MRRRRRRLIMHWRQLRRRLRLRLNWWLLLRLGMGLRRWLRDGGRWRRKRRRVREMLL